AFHSGPVCPGAVLAAVVRAAAAGLRPKRRAGDHSQDHLYNQRGGSMMQAIAETLFDIVYLVSVITIGVLIIRGCKGERQFRLFGWMAVVLGAGDAFHLIPRAFALCTTGLENYTAALGLGKWITSITMTVFYVLLYYVWRQRYQVQGQSGLTAAV